MPDIRTNSLLITTASQNFEVLRLLIKRLDIETPKVLLEVRLVEVIQTTASRIGTRYSSDGSIFESNDFNSGFLNSFGLTWEEVTKDSVLTGEFSLAVLIQFLQRNFNVRVVSQPKLAVNNNKEAKTFVGSQVPFITSSQTPTGTVATEASFEYRPVGITLKTRPHTNRNDKVVTAVEITSGQFREGEALFGGFVLGERTYQTELAVESGQAMIIGGILQQEESESIHRVPTLGHIPVLGLLFSKTGKTITTTELIAFIIPTVLRTRADDDAATRREDEQIEESKRHESRDGENKNGPGKQARRNLIGWPASPELDDLADAGCGRYPHLPAVHRNRDFVLCVSEVGPAYKDLPAQPKP